jgi:hypothetical protein
MLKVILFGIITERLNLKFTYDGLEVQILELIEKLNESPNLRDENKLYKLLAKIENERIQNNGKRQREKNS